MTATQKKFVPVKGWPIKVKTIVDDSMSHQDPGTDIEGEGVVLPDWEEACVRVGGQIFNREVYIVTAREGVAERLYYEVQDGDHLFVTGDLSHRQHLRGFPHLRTTLWVEDFEIDPSKGKVSPLIGYLECADDGEYTSAADLRYAKFCSHCGTEKNNVPESQERYCPSCET